MSDLPLEYHTAYTWSGNAEAGETIIEGPPPLAVGSPHSQERYSPEHLLVVAAETCPGKLRDGHLWAVEARGQGIPLHRSG